MNSCCIQNVFNWFISQSNGLSSIYQVLQTKRHRLNLEPPLEVCNNIIWVKQTDIGIQTTTNINQPTNSTPWQTEIKYSKLTITLLALCDKALMCTSNTKPESGSAIVSTNQRYKQQHSEMRTRVFNACLMLTCIGIQSSFCCCRCCFFFWLADHNYTRSRNHKRSVMIKTNY